LRQDDNVAGVPLLPGRGRRKARARAAELLKPSA
jgi:hypothetical protein